MIITSQISLEGWYDLIGEKTVADAILDRMVQNASVQRFRFYESKGVVMEIAL